MATFEYQAMDHQGEEVQGAIEAADEHDARDQIRALGYFVTKLERIADDIPATDEGPSRTLDDQLLDLLRQSRKIEAIKAYRAATGAGLAQAKEQVESLARAHGLPGSASAGCAGSTARLLALVLLLATALYWAR